MRNRIVRYSVATIPMITPARTAAAIEETKTHVPTPPSELGGITTAVVSGACASLPDAQHGEHLSRACGEEMRVTRQQHRPCRRWIHLSDRGVVRERLRPAG